MNSFKFYKNNKHIQIAHRGHSSIRPENTMSAFESSIQKTKMLELDVAFTSDKIAIVIHDDTFERTSNILEIFPNKIHSYIHELSFDDIKKLDLSIWFIKDDPHESIKKGLVLKDEISTQKISTLEEVLIFCKKNKISVNVEIKDLSDTPFHGCAVDKIVSIIKKCNMQDETIISSFNLEYIFQICERYPTMNKAILQEEKHLKDINKILLKNNIQAYHCSDEIVNKEIVHSLLEVNIPTCVFTVNDKKRKEELFSWGVKAVFTDYLDY